MEVETSIEFDSSMPEEVRNALAMVAVLQSYCRLLKKLGLTKEEAMQRAPAAISHAWED